MTKKTRGRHVAAPAPHQCNLRTGSGAMKVGSVVALTALGLGLGASPAMATETSPSQSTSAFGTSAQVEEGVEAPLATTPAQVENPTEPIETDPTPAPEEPAPEPTPEPEPTEEPAPEPVPNEAPTLAGIADVTIAQGEAFDPLAGVTANDTEDGDLTGSIQVSGSVDTNTPGSYTLTYTVTDASGAQATAQRVVTVEAPANTAPTFAGIENVELTVGDSFDPMAGVTATDAEDGDLTGAIEVTGSVDTGTAGTYTLTYTVTDSAGETTSAERTVTVVEEANEAPTFSGIEDVELTVGDSFDPRAGVTATDAEDGDLTDAIEISGTVDTETAGTYTLTYTVTDSAGETVTAERTVTVVEEANEAPTFSGIEDATISQGDDFDPLEGVTARDAEDGDLTSQINVSGTIDTGTPGEYVLTYSVTDSRGETTTAKRTITVEAVNTAPTFAGVDDATIAEGEDFDPLEGVRATDAEDGDITDRIEVTGSVDTSTPGEYVLTYSVTDSGGKTTTVQRTITVTEVVGEAPTLHGIRDITISEGDDFDPLEGVTARDAEDGDITDRIEVTGSVDTSTPGEYVLTYTVTDSSGLTASETRTVTVEYVNQAPVLEAADVTLTQGQAFDPMAGVRATDREDGDLTGQVVVLSNPVDVNTPGTYQVVYSVTDSDGATTTLVRTVTVNAAPEEPGNPEEPENPEQPEEPGNPEEPENPENPGTPEEPENPGVPEDPGTPEDPGNPEDPGETPEPGEPGEEDPTPEQPGDPGDDLPGLNPDEPGEDTPPDEDLPGLNPEDPDGGVGEDPREDLPGLNPDDPDDGVAEDPAEDLPGLVTDEDDGVGEGAPLALPGLESDEDGTVAQDEDPEGTPEPTDEPSQSATPSDSPSASDSPDAQDEEDSEKEASSPAGWIAAIAAALAAAAGGFWWFLFGRRKKSED